MARVWCRCSQHREDRLTTTATPFVLAGVERLSDQQPQFLLVPRATRSKFGLPTGGSKALFSTQKVITVLEVAVN
jgi:hypothetical protein